MPWLDSRILERPPPTLFTMHELLFNVVHTEKIE